MLAILLAGCFKPYTDMPNLDFSEVDYSNPHMTTTDAVIASFESSLPCPDGERARFFAVYSASLPPSAPVAIVMHSGAFDYVVQPDPSGYLAGEHYNSDDRLGRQWAIGKIWETLGISATEVDDDENNSGTLPAALTDAGVVQLYPSNCWGDLWHNEAGFQDNDYQEEGFSRNGRTIAYWMIRMIVEEGFARDQGFQVPVTLDKSSVYLIGLGEGGRGVSELLTHDTLPGIRGVLVDGSPDLLAPYLADPQTWEAEITGLERIFFRDDEENPESIDEFIDDWSMLAVAQGAAELPERTGFVWSSADPQVPYESAAPTAAALSELDSTWVHDTATSSHVFLNDDAALAQQAVDYLLGG